MFTVGDAEVVVRVISLHDTVGRGGGAEGEDGGGATGTLSVADLLDGDHFMRRVVSGGGGGLLDK